MKKCRIKLEALGNFMTYSQIFIIIIGFIVPTLILLFGPFLLLLAFRKREKNRVQSYDPLREEIEVGDLCPLGLKDPVTDSYYDILTCNNLSCEHYDVMSGCQWHNRRDSRKPVFDDRALDQIFKVERTRKLIKKMALYFLIGFLVLLSLLIIFELSRAQKPEIGTLTWYLMDKDICYDRSDAKNS